MTAVLSVLPSSRVTLEHVEALQSCNRIVTHTVILPDQTLEKWGLSNFAF